MSKHKPNPVAEVGVMFFRGAGKKRPRKRARQHSMLYRTIESERLVGSMSPKAHLALREHYDNSGADCCHARAELGQKRAAFSGLSEELQLVLAFVPYEWCHIFVEAALFFWRAHQSARSMNFTRGWKPRACIMS